MERKVRIEIIFALGMALLAASTPALAGGFITGADGSISVTNQVRDDSNGDLLLHDCTPHGDFGLPDIGENHTPSVNPSCAPFSHPCTDDNGQTNTTSVGAASAVGSASGDSHHVAVHVAGSGSASITGTASCRSGIPLSEARASGSINFTIADQPAGVTISVLISTPVGSDIAVTLFRNDDSTNLGQITADNSGTIGSIPSATLPPGGYSLQYNALVPTLSSIQSNNGPYSFDISMDLSVGDGPLNIHWTESAGGAFGTASNWNPTQVPDSSDKAFFDLAADAPVVVTATNNTVARMVVRRMNVALLGGVRALGLAGDFSFEVDDGGTLTLGNGVLFETTNAIVGSQVGTESSVFVSGANTKWSSTESDRVVIGSHAPGKVVVDHNGALESSTDITVGDTAAGTLRVESGGQVSAPDCSILKGSVQVRGSSAGSNSALTLGGDLNIGGQSGTGNMVIEAGGIVSAERIFVGDAAGTGGETLTVSGLDDAGNPSTLKTQSIGELHVAGNDATQLEIKDGGQLATSGTVRIGEGLVVGKLIVHGKSGPTSASWLHEGDAFVGGQIAPSRLIVEESGTARITNQLQLGKSAGDLGSANISGSDTRLSCGTLLIGIDGQGDLRISDGSFVTSTVQTKIGVSSQVVSVPTVPTNASGGTGVGSVIIEGDPRSELLVLGDCVVGFDEGGTVQLRGGDARLTVNGTLVNGVHGVISGNGTLTAGDVANGGIISPGLSPGVINIEGNYEQTPDGVLKIELAGLGDGQFDVLSVTGDAALGGTLEVHMLDGFLLKARDSVDFLKVGGAVSGDFTQIVFPDLAPGFNVSLTKTDDGKLRLIANNDATPGDGTTVNPPADLSNPCGAGLCGAGSTTMLPLLMLVGYFRRRTRPNESPL